MRFLPTVIGLTFAFLFLVPSDTRAQSVLVRVTEAETNRPISGAFVSLLTEEGEAVRSALTNGTGRFLFLVPYPGVFRIRAQMIGKETRLSSPLTVLPGEAGQVSLSLPVQAIQLEGIEVEASQQCRVDPAEASELSLAWEEARKALSLQAWTEDEGIYRFQIASYERDLDRDGRKVERENRRSVSVQNRTPIGSLPVEDLMAHGFVRPSEGGGYQYYVPDATVLLSDLFLETHCFRLERSPEVPEALGLSFEPVRETDQPDINGTLWLDESTASLKFIEFGYNWAPHEEAEGFASGRVEFEQMPNGSWIVDRWWIRVPILAQDRNMIRLGYSGIWVAGVRETGGEVLEVSTLAEESVSEKDQGSLSGVVWDSLSAGPLAEATVFLSGTEHFGVTDQAGHFFIDGLPEGIFTAKFSHPRLDTLGLSPPEREVEIPSGGKVEIQMSIPSATTILTTACRSEERVSGASILTGVVTEGATREPIPGASVRFEWQEIVGTHPNVRALNQWFEVPTNGEGRYTACGVPIDEAMVVQASFLGVESDTVHLRLLEEDYQILDFAIQLPLGTFSTRTEALELEEGVGIQGVQGILLDPASGNPVRSAEVAIRQSPGHVIVTGVTDTQGFFRLQTPTPGTYVFSAQALGYAEIGDKEVSVLPGRLSVLEVRMPPEALAMEPLVVSAEPRVFKLEMQGFYDRRRKGLDSGIFIPPEVLEERQPRRLSDLFFEMPGTRVIETTVGGRGVFFRSGERGLQDTCWPMVFLDRHLVSTGGFLAAGGRPTAVDDLVPTFDVSAVEVYRSPAEIPPEFNGPNAGCGVIVIWTKTGGGG